MVRAQGAYHSGAMIFCELGVMTTTSLRATHKNVTHIAGVFDRSYNNIH